MPKLIPVLLFICGLLAVFLGVWQFESLPLTGADRAALIGAGALVAGWAACMFDEVKNG